MRWWVGYVWITGLLSTWVPIFLYSSRRKFAAFYSGGIWSVIIGFAVDYTIRRHLGWWNLDRAVAALLGVRIATYVGPRFVEGVFFFNLMPKQTSLQLPYALFMALSALATDALSANLGYANLSPRLLTVSLLSHLLRFMALLAIFYGMSYELRAERLGLIKKQASRQKIGKSLWKLSWIPLYFGVRAIVGRMEKKQR
jgi:hypothetical protein